MQNLVASLLAVDEVLVLGNVVDRVNILNAYRAVIAAINHVESLGDHVLLALSQRVSQAADELFVGNVAIAIDIVVAHERLNLDDLGEEVVGSKGLRELSLVELTVAIVVHATENDAEGTNADSTTLLDLHLELIVDAADFDVEANAVKLRHSVFVWELQKLIIN